VLVIEFFGIELTLWFPLEIRMDETTTTPMWFALESENFEVCKMLISAGSDLDAVLK
jgi:hypothetical protein